MALHRKQPHPMRGPLILILILLALIAGLIALSRSATEVPVKAVEVDVAIPAAR
jgi:hypothetical protein